MNNNGYDNADKEEYIKLMELIDYHMNKYYNQDEPEISDYEYDNLMSRLKAIEAKHPDWITKDSPTQKIGEDIKREAGEKVVHDVPMLSIMDVFTKEDVKAWVNKVKGVHPDCKFSVETKIDGLSLSLRYRNEEGKLHMYLGETRGNGIEGADVTANALVIPDIKQIIDLPYDALELRGEVYMSHASFDKYNEEQERLGKKTAANPRNLAAGTLKLLDANVTKERGLKMFIFNVQSGPSELTNSHTEGLDILAKKGVPVVYHRCCENAEEVLNTIDEIGNMREELPYDIDGAVVKIDHVAYRDDFPAGSKYSSGHIAYKYPPEEREIVMDDIIVDVGRTGKLTFTGAFHDKETGKAARLCGTSVSRATLHNQDYITQMKIGIGGTYKLFKSGEIIPKLNGCVAEPDKVFTAPKHCPVCGSTLIRDEDTADIKCINPSCHAQLVRTVSYFVSLNCMNIMGFGEKYVEALIQNGYINNYADIYTLREHRDELIEKGLIGKEKNTDKLLDAIDKSKQNSPEKLLTALGIPNVGKSTASEIMKHFEGIRKLQGASVEELMSIQDIGETTAKCIHEFFKDEQNIAVLDKLEACGVNMNMPNVTAVSNKLEGKTVVITGGFENLGRADIEKLVTENGGKCTGSVSKKTSFLIVGEAAGSKLTKAESLGIKTVSLNEFLDMIK